MSLRLLYVLFICLYTFSPLYVLVEAEGQTGQRNYEERNYGDSTTLQLKILAEKQYIAYEPILITVQLANISRDKTLQVFVPLLIVNHCNVSAPDEKKLSLNFDKQGAVRPASTEPLSPGKMVSRTFNLLDYFDLGKPGNYTIEYNYPLFRATIDSKGQRILHDAGTLTTKQNIKVVPPDKSTDREALKIFQPAIEKYLRGYNSGEIRASFRRVTDEHPKSRYAATSLYFLAESFSLSYRFMENSIKIYQELMEKYPDSFYSDLAKEKIEEVRDRAVREQEVLKQIERNR